MRRICLSLLLLTSALTGARCEPEPSVPVSAPAPPNPVIAIGQIEGWREAAVASRIPGRVLRYEVAENVAVTAGRPVVQLEARDLRAQLRVARASAEEARENRTRIQHLRAEGVASEKEWIRAEMSHRARSAELEQASVLLDDATIRAPFDGTVIHHFKEVGEAVAMGAAADPLFLIADLSRLKVRAEVPEADIGRVRPGQAARVRPDAYPGEEFGASVTRIALAVGRKQRHSDDPRERLDEKVVEVELVLDPDARLKSGMTVDVVFSNP